MTDEKELTDFQKQWEIIVNKANIDYKGTNNYNTLTKEEQVWYNIQLLISAAGNGGIISFFYNHEGNYYLETIESLKILKQEKVIKLLEKSAKIFPKGVVPKDIVKRNEIIEKIPDGKYAKMFNKIDNEFFELENKLEADLINYIIEHGLI